MLLLVETYMLIKQRRNAISRGLIILLSFLDNLKSSDKKGGTYSGTNYTTITFRVNWKRRLSSVTQSALLTYLCTFCLFLQSQIFRCHWLLVICIHHTLIKGCHSCKVSNFTKVTFRETIPNQMLIDLCLTTPYLKLTIWEGNTFSTDSLQRKMDCTLHMQGSFLTNLEIVWCFMHLSLCSVIGVLFPDDLFSGIDRVGS